MATSRSILYENLEKTVCLIDIPGSISHAQGTSNELSLLSRAPLEAPFEVKNEPSKGKHVDSDTVEEEYHRDIKNLIIHALQEIKSSHTGSWCVSRKLVPAEQGRRRSKKRKLAAVDDAREKEICIKSEDHVMDSPDLYTTSKAEPQLDFSRLSSSNKLQKQDLTTYGPVCLRVLSEAYNRPFHNTGNEQLPLSIRASNSGSCHKYYLPSHSTFILSRTEDSITTFKHAAAHYLSSSTASAGPSQFDFILLDPPWPNASAKRAGSYHRIKTVHDTASLLRSMRLEDHLAPTGMIGIWITNKRSIRNLFLPPTISRSSSMTPAEQQPSPASLFATWGVTLIEEWIWIKTTTHGEPVTAIDSVWRKPYEILLLARRVPPESIAQSPSPTQQAHQAHQAYQSHLHPDLPGTYQPQIKRRVIAGVPDLHSRKPCLKDLIEPLMPHPTRYRALEVFARHLTAGWWAWGDQVLKFNWEGAWTTLTSNSNAPTITSTIATSTTKPTAAKPITTEPTTTQH